MSTGTTKTETDEMIATGTGTGIEMMTTENDDAVTAVTGMTRIETETDVASTVTRMKKA